MGWGRGRRSRSSDNDMTRQTDTQDKEENGARLIPIYLLGRPSSTFAVATGSRHPPSVDERDSNHSIWTERFFYFLAFILSIFTARFLRRTDIPSNDIRLHESFPIPESSTTLLRLNSRWRASVREEKARR